MDFFEQQAKAHRKTKWLVIYFVMAVIAMIATVYIAALLIFSGVEAHQRFRYDQGAPQFSAWNPEIFFGVSLAILAIVGCGSAYKTMSLSAGGSAVSELIGGRLIKTTTTDLDERKLLNVVEEMSIASGVPMPQVYVMDEENGINAFAAGHKPSDATVTVTRGCMKILSRDELQGVIGHEFSHILNGDMRLNLRLMGIIFGILCLAIIGRILLYSARGGGGRRGGQNPLPLLGLVILIVGYIGVFFGRLIQAAVSRQREFLADASSVQFTRNPSGITGALKKIGGLGEMGSRLDHAHAEELSHMFFGNGVSEPFIGLLETHPPLADRIRVFEPTFDGTFPGVRYDDRTALEQEQEQEPSSQRPRQPMPNLFGTVVGGAIWAGGDEPPIMKPPVIKPHAVLPNVGNPTPMHLKYAEQLRDSLPDAVRAAVRDPMDATALIYAMLLGDDEGLRTKQLAGIEQQAGAAVRQKTVALLPGVAQTAARARLPMVNLALGALKQLSRDQYDVFSKTLDWLIKSDGNIEPFEFVLKKIVLRHLDSQFHGATKPITQFYSVKPLAPDCSVVLSALAHAGSEDNSDTQKAFDAGAPYLRAPEDSDLGFLPAAQSGVEQLNNALNRLVMAAPIIKKNVIDACVHVVGADGVIRESEAELLRAVCDTLDCPMPPLIN
ncbi:MAG TPA: M48 family metallopeptidase [Verrucomicrobiae bacterium]|jgi:Zn-dependent protease with chaperone function|nr:M48 family metallopeptidase [Verrucomicrobiae bacterium]